MCCAGQATLLRMSDSLVEFSKDERAAVSSLFDRETRRERILAAAAREAEVTPVPAPRGEAAEAGLPVEERIREAEAHYFETIKSERDLRVAQLQRMAQTEERDI